MPASDPKPDGSELHERFIRESREIDEAYANGTLDEWIKRKLEDERQSAN